MKHILIFFLLFAVIVTSPSCSKPLQLINGSPAAEGMSAERLNRIDTMIQKSIDSNWIMGATCFIARNGRIIYHKAFGFSNDDPETPIKTDDIFRIASQSKAITSVAVMILFEEGKFLLDDPVSKYIPEFAYPLVLDKFNGIDTTFTAIPARREITIRDLLTHTSGIDAPKIGSTHMTAIYDKAGIPAGFESQPLILGENIKKLAKLPLAHNPGEQFTYGLSTDVLGYLVEVISGINFDQFLRQRIFDPLGMDDTYFYLPEDKQSRLIPVYTEDASKHLVKINTKIYGVDINYPMAKGTYFSGGAGLSSTIRDYAMFLQMLLNRGLYNGKRILSPRTVDLMTCNQIEQLYVGADKFGMGFGITTKAGQAILGVSEGTFSWGGVWGTTYWADPKEKLVCLLFLQQWPLSHGEIQDKFIAMVYAALEE